MRAFVAAAALFAASAYAQEAPTREDPAALARVYACAEEADPAARLACFDDAVSALRSAQSAGEFAAVDRVQVEQVEREAFGFSLPSLPRLTLPRLGSGAASQDTAGIEEVDMTIERVVMRPDGKAVFIMTNGQRWAQIEPERTRLVRPGGTVTIRRAVLGSFLMSVHAGGPAHRVRREQ